MKNAKDNWLRFLLVLGLLGMTSVVVRRQGEVEHLPHREEFASFPSRIGDWQGTDIHIRSDVRAVLGDGDFMERVYRRASQEPVIDLFLAYFPSQQPGSTMHSPQNCLPGGGWTPIAQAPLQVSVPGMLPITVSRYEVAKGAERQLLLYWYEIHGRSVADEYRAKLFLVADAIRMKRRDGAMGRIATALAPGDTAEAGQRRAVEFAQAMVPQLRNFIPP